MTTQQPVQRPMGVTILGVLQIIAGLLGLCLPVFLLTIGLAATLIGGPLGALGLCAGALMLLGPVLHFIVAFGAFNLQPWTWWLGLAATGVDVLGALANLWNGVGIAQAIVPVGFSLIVFVYLLTPDVRQAFRI